MLDVMEHKSLTHLQTLVMPKLKQDAIVVSKPTNKPWKTIHHKKNTYPLQNLPVKVVALMFRAILKHFKYGMTDLEKQEFVGLIQKQSHCPKGTAASIAKILKSKI